MIFLLSFPLRDCQQRRKKQQTNDSGGHRFGVPEWRSRLAILIKSKKNNVTPILGHIKLAFPLGDSQQEKTTTTGPVLEVIVFQQQEAIL